MRNFECMDIYIFWKQHFVSLISSMNNACFLWLNTLDSGKNWFGGKITGSSVWIVILFSFEEFRKSHSVCPISIDRAKGPCPGKKIN